MSSSLTSVVPPSVPADKHVSSIGHLLVCLDRSARSDSCLPYARFVAEAFGARITLLHVLPASPAHEPNRSDALEWEITKREASHYLNEAKLSLELASHDIVTRLEQGAPARQIVAIGREKDVDLTILSSHGEGGESAFDLGSIAQHVLAFAAGSVLLAQPMCTARVPPKRILVPLDGSVRSESVLPVVVGLAQLHGAEVVLVHVVKEPTATAVFSDPEDMRTASSLASRVEGNADAYLGRIRARLLHQVPVVESYVARRPEERQALLDLAAQHNVDLIVVTAHGSTCNLECVFGSVPSYLLAHSQLPVFVLQDMPRGQHDLVRGHVARAAFGSRPPESD